MGNNLKRLPIGVDDFSKVCSRNRYYVDKTLLIKELIDDNYEIVLITRPRRFGKTLNLSMLRYFFEINSIDYSNLFKDLNIWQAGHLYREEQGKYPVIYLTMKDIIAENLDSFVKMFKAMIAEEFKRHTYLLDSSSLLTSDRKKFNDIVNEVACIEDYGISLEFISRLLYQHHQRNTMIFIDEYDTPINYAFIYGFYDRIVSIMKRFLGSALKGNPYLERGVMTGIYRIGKESIFSGLNNLHVCDVTVNTYADKFGFMDHEVKDLLDYYGLRETIEDVEEWYNGYLFGDSKIIYNPWSIIKYVESGRFEPYWINTGSDDILQDIIRRSDTKTKKELSLLLQGDSVSEVSIDTGISFKDIQGSSVIDSRVLWNFLLISGYLKIENKRSGALWPTATIKTPNREMLASYQRIIMNLFHRHGIPPDPLSSLIHNLLQGNVEDFETRLKEIARTVFSAHDMAINRAESFLHGFLLCMIVHVMDDYEIYSNQESGDGRPDLLLIPKNKHEGSGIIIELKRSSNKSAAAMKTAVEAALLQIEKKRYIDGLIDKGLERIILVGIAFSGKHIKIGYKKVPGTTRLLPKNVGGSDQISN